MRAGVIRNPRARAHRRGRASPVVDGAPVAEPSTPEALREVLRAWAALGVTRLVVDGGDGTVHQVLGVLHEVWEGRPVELAVLPSGTTNALAHDLGVPRGWTLAAALAASHTVARAPLEVVRPEPGASVRRGFVWGAGVFTDVAAMGARLHAAGLFGRVMLGAALTVAAVRVLAGPRSDPWRAGRPLRLDDDPGARFLLLASTLETLPLGLKPFGPVRPGLKLLDVAAPPRRLASALLPVLTGREVPWLTAAGYRRMEAEAVRISTPAPYILDGELFEGGDLLLRRGAPLSFVVP